MGSKMELDAKQIDAIAELRRHGIPYTLAGDDWAKVHCPFHADKSASCGLNIRENYYKCQAAGCGAGGDLIAFLTQALKTTRVLLLKDLVTRYELNDSITIEPSVIERDHTYLWECGPQLQELRNRAVSDDAIRKYRIGARKPDRDGAVRVTIPIKNAVGLYVNVRKYLPGAPGADKMRNEPHCGSSRLYPIEQLDYSTIVICGGELKAIIAAEELNEHGIGAVSPTGGEGNWKDDFTEVFTGKKVYVCYDIDKAGITGAKNVCKNVSSVALWCGLLKLPLAIDEFPHGDINDYVAGGGKLFPLLESCEEFAPVILAKEPLAPIAVTLQQAMQFSENSQPLEFDGCISAHGAAFRVPKVLKVRCDKGQPFCGICPVSMVENETSTYEIESGNAQLLRYIGENKSKWLAYDKELLGIPSQCHVVAFERLADYTLQDIEMSDAGSTHRGIWFKPENGVAAAVTEKYTFTGTSQAFPSNSEAVIFAYQQELRDNELSEYQQPKDNGEHLQVFRPLEWNVDALELKLTAIHDDLGNNVLRVYFRNDMNLIADLAFHSVLQIPYDGGVKRGWVDVLIVGDSGQAKTSMLDGLIRHYGLGVKKDCKNATVPGLLATTRKGLSGQFLVVAGSIPQNDRQLVVLEEFKGIQGDVMQRLTEVRSSGKLTVSKAGHGVFDARVRLVIMSNPKSTRAVSDYSFGIEILAELIPNLEDLRRFDAAIILSKDDIMPGKLSTRTRDPLSLPHIYTAGLCRELIIWAWTRTPEQIEISRETFGLILDNAKDLQTEFTDALPLIDSTMREKLTKLSVALAARTFSSSDDGCNIIVRPCHVEFITAALRRIYSQPSFGYAAYSASLKVVTNFREKPVDEAIRELGLALSFVENARHHDRLSSTDIGNWIGATDYSQSTALISLLVRTGALMHVQNTAGASTLYTKTAEFSAYLKRVEVTNTKGPVLEEKF